MLPFIVYVRAPHAKAWTEHSRYSDSGMALSVARDQADAIGARAYRQTAPREIYARDLAAIDGRIIGGVSIIEEK
jgi:hypothetical protein